MESLEPCGSSSCQPHAFVFPLSAGWGIDSPFPQVWPWCCLSSLASALGALPMPALVVPWLLLFAFLRQGLTL